MHLPPLAKTGPKWCMCFRAWEDCYHSYCSRCGVHTTRGEHTDIQDVRTRRFTPANDRCEADVACWQDHGNGKYCRMPVGHPPLP